MTRKNVADMLPNTSMDTTFTNKEASEEKSAGSKPKEPNRKPGVDNPDQMPEEIPEPEHEESAEDEKGHATETMNNISGTVITNPNSVENKHPMDAQRETKSGEKSPDQASNEINNTGKKRDTPEVKNKTKSEGQMHASEKTRSKADNGNKNPEENNWISSEEMYSDETSSGEEKLHNSGDGISMPDEALNSPEKETGNEGSVHGSKESGTEEKTDNKPEENNSLSKEETYPEKPTSGEQNSDQQTHENTKHEKKNINSDTMKTMKPEGSYSASGQSKTKLKKDGENHEDNSKFSNEDSTHKDTVISEDNPHDEPVDSEGSKEIKETKSMEDKPDEKNKEALSDQEGNVFEYLLSDEDNTGQKKEEHLKSDAGQGSSYQKYQETTLKNSPTSESGLLDPSPTTDNSGKHHDEGSESIAATHNPDGKAEEEIKRIQNILRKNRTPTTISSDNELPKKSTFVPKTGRENTREVVETASKATSSDTSNPDIVENEGREKDMKDHSSRELTEETPSTQNQKIQNGDSRREEIQTQTTTDNPNSDVDSPYPDEIPEASSESESNRREENKVIDLQYHKNKPATNQTYEPAYDVMGRIESQRNQNEHNSNENTPATKTVAETTTERNLTRGFEHTAVNQTPTKIHPTGSETAQPVTGGDAQKEFDQSETNPEMNKFGEYVTAKLKQNQGLATTQSPLDSENTGA
jgi:hypothetical protein